MTVPSHSPLGVATRARLVWVAAMTAFVIACAVPEPPSGGPEDKVAPAVEATVPIADSAGVDPGSALSITFSEDMSRSGVERLLDAFPPIRIGSVNWSGRTIRIMPEGGWRIDTTYVIQMRAGFRDRHKVASRNGYRLAFATSAAIDSGTIVGRVMFRRKPSVKAVVRCFVLPRDSSFAVEAARPDREVAVGEGGLYRLDYLPASNNGFLVWAFEDVDQNGTFAPGSEVGGELGDTVWLKPDSAHARVAKISIVDPREPASISGRVDNRSGIDTVRVAVRLTALADTTGRGGYFAYCQDDGAFSFGEVKAGVYQMVGFVDVRPDSVCGNFDCFSGVCQEPCAEYPDSLKLEPGERAVLNPLIVGGVRP